ncbi:MAG: acetyltransferase [Nitrospiraceae bacterium]
MATKQDLILIGGGGHCLSCLDVIELHGGFNVLGIVDEKNEVHRLLGEYPLLGHEEDLPILARTCPNFLVTIGQIKLWEPRFRVYAVLKELGVNLPTVVSPLAHVARNAKLGEGTIVMHHAVVNAGATVGGNCIINTRALVEHDAVIEDHCHISTGAIINGGATVRQRSFIGSNAVLRERIVVGEESIVGAGVAVTQDLPSGSLIRP